MVNKRKMSIQIGNILIVDDNKSILSTLEILSLLNSDCNNTVKSETAYSAELEKGLQPYILDMNFTAGVNTGNEGFTGSEE